MRLDLHIHSIHSGDSHSAPADIVRTAEEKGMDGMAIMDHNTLRGYHEAKKVDSDMIIVPGLEVSTPEGHVLAFGLQEEIGRQDSIPAAIEMIREHDALAVAAHPYRFWSGIGEEHVLKNNWDAIEGMNGRGWGFRNRQAQALAESLDTPVTGGSDSHRLKTIGKAYTIVENVEDWHDVIKKVKDGDADVGGKNRTIYQTFFYVKRALSGWIRRGFKRI